ncbi:ATP-dependent Clp protease ATP-binding subunit ClpC [Candidatus Parcubacteria bacterium]|nr:MAG: ATP-dependent Clp protease ATP-binding subunit ClpC [Candidatus Parcubacteria bacterium]
MFDKPQNILNKFTYNFKKVLINAQNMAYAKKRAFIEPEDLLFSLLQSKGSLGSDILIKQKVDPNFLTTLKLTNNFRPVSADPNKMPQPSDSAQQIIEKAVVTAYKHQHKYIGTEHLLWGLAQSEDQKIKQNLEKAKVNISNLQQHLNLILKSTSKFGDLAKDEEIKDFDDFLEDNSSETGNLDNFTINLTSQEIQKDIDPVIGRVKEIDRLIEILSRRTKNNPVLLGDAGVGKTAIVEGLAKRITEGNVPAVLLNKTILNLDIPSLLAGTMYRGEFESRLKQVINDIKNNKNIILFIDELHTIMGAGATTGSLDAANILKPALSRGHLRCIGATTFEEYKKHIESDKALERRFQSILINESSEEETLEILSGLKENYEKFHKVQITEEAMKSAVSLSKRFLPDKNFPDKAIDLIDEAAARFRVRHTKESLLKQIKNLQNKVEICQNSKKQAILKENYVEALEYKNQEEKYLEELVRLKALDDKNKQNNLGTISDQHIKEIIADTTGVPMVSITDDENKRLLSLDKNIKQNIFGQNKAIETISNTIRKAKTGLHDKNRPLASFMFLGPSGVGKTETAKRLAQHIFGGPQNMIRIDMSEFSEKFNISKLIGAPAGYVGYKEGNKFTDLVKNKPYSLVLFDEIEKAHPDVYSLLLPVLEEGELTDATGRTVNFKNTIIIMTSNIGLNQFNQKASLGFAVEGENNDFSQTSNEVLSSLKKYLPPEFTNRLDNIMVFEPLDNNAAKKIIKQELQNLNERLIEREVKINFDNKIINHLLKDKNAAKEGARSLKRLVDAQITNPIASVLLTSKANRVNVKLIKDKITIN